MKTLVKNFLLVLLVFLGISAFFSLLESSNKPKDISISQLAIDVNQGKIKEITVSGDKVSIDYKDDTKAVTRKETESSLSDSLINYGSSKDSLSAAQINIKEAGGFWIWLDPLLFSVLPLLVFGYFFWSFLNKSKGGSSQAFSFTKNKAQLFGVDSPEKTTFDDVAGLKEVKIELKEVVDFLRNPKKYTKMGASIPRGVLLIGSSGTGKTLLARAIAGEAGVPFFHTAGSSFVELFVGTGAARVRDLFSVAKKSSPCIVFIDEIDAVGRMRGTGIGGGNDEREQTLNQLLTEMDGFNRKTNVIVIGATNRPDVLDSALLRPGRFDRRVTFDLPDIRDRESVLKIHFKGKPAALDVNLREVAERTPGFSGADLANVVNEAAILAARSNKDKIHQEDFLESIEKVLLGPEKRSRVISVEEKEIAAYHEAGHALTSDTLLASQPVRKISIIPRGNAAGYVLKTPKEEKRMETRSEFLDSMSVLLGGYCAEKIIFGEVTTGASNDLERASELARRLVKVYGMSSLGPVVFGESNSTVFLGKEISEQRNYSEKTAVAIDEEVSKFIHQAYKNTEKILLEKKALLEKIAKRLIEKETIEREEFEEIMGKKVEKKIEKKIEKKESIEEVKKQKDFEVKIKDL